MAKQRSHLRLLICLLPAFLLLITFVLALSHFRHSVRITAPTTPSESSSLGTTHYDPRPLDITLGLFSPDDINPDTFDFTPPDVKPAWLERNRTNGPLVIRMGIISAPDEFDRRKAFREYILHGLAQSEVVVQHRFLIGWADPATNTSADQDRLVLEEHLHHRDIHRLDMTESRLRLGEKRWRMLRWAGEAHSSTYDYYLNADTDAFFRLLALARRIPYLLSLLPEDEDEKTRTVDGNRSSSSPKTESIMIGRMESHKVHFKPNPYDNASTYETEDIQLTPEEIATSSKIKSAWYPHPIGFGFLLSSHLVEKLLAPGVMLAHHVHYPSDDVLVGQWVNEEAPETRVIDDKRGFHDALGHNFYEEKTAAITWDTVCAHHLSPSEIRGMRRRKEYEREWIG